jgi:PiT family inorganic phosphate transporter
LWIVLTALFTSPLIGFVAGMIVIRLILWLARGATPKINLFFKFAQVPTAIILSLSHGTNDAQKAMGMITLGLVVAGEQSGFAVPWWVIVACAAAIGLGTAAGGWRIIRTLGGKFYRIRSVHSFASQLSSGMVILLVTLLAGQYHPSRQFGDFGGGGRAARFAGALDGVERDLDRLVAHPARFGGAGGAHLLFDKSWFIGNRRDSLEHLAVKRKAKLIGSLGIAVIG